MYWKIKVEIGRWQKKRSGERRGPVVVDMSATGAAEMEGDA